MVLMQIKFVILYERCDLRNQLYIGKFHITKMHILFWIFAECFRKKQCNYQQPPQIEGNANNSTRQRLMVQAFKPQTDVPAGLSKTTQESVTAIILDFQSTSQHLIDYKFPLASFHHKHYFTFEKKNTQFFSPWKAFGMHINT